MTQSKILDIEKIIQRLWDRIKKPAAGKKSSIKLEKNASTMTIQFWEF